MGKATRWLKGLLGMKKEKDHCDCSGSVVPAKNEKKRSGKDEASHVTAANVTAFDHAWIRSYVTEKEDEKIKHAIDVGVVRLRSHDRGTLFNGSTEKWAALKIQSFFRGYLARRALRALKGLVRIQALVRGYLVRKRVAATLHSMQAMIRAQAVARSQRARRSTNRDNRFHPQIRSPQRVKLFDETINEIHNKRSPLYSKTFLNGFDERPKVVEVDNTHMPHSRSRSIPTAKSECGEDLQYQAIASPLHCSVPGRASVHECRHRQNFEWHFNVNQHIFPTAQSTPRFADCMVPNTPVKSVSGGSFFRPCSNFPNYMANTHSSKAKVRSYSAPKQRPELNTTRLSLNEMMTARNSISGVRMQCSSNPKAQDYPSFDQVI
ncbi:hypothetical protein VNO77_29257 [Canavalia gladiata]|uniref:DUF4005 domain-containing protein n=1 Tax=Canavalia gladiata TaxID=3824 RepID=A0AAN9Q7L3_CANGL